MTTDTDPKGETGAFDARAEAHRIYDDAHPGNLDCMPVHGYECRYLAAALQRAHDAGEKQERARIAQNAATADGRFAALEAALDERTRERATVYAERDRLTAELAASRQACEQVGARSIKACRFLRRARKLAEHGPSCGDSAQPPECDCGYDEFTEDLDAFLAATPTIGVAPEPTGLRAYVGYGVQCDRCLWHSGWIERKEDAEAMARRHVKAEHLAAPVQVSPEPTPLLFVEAPRAGACKACGRREGVDVGQDRFCSPCRGTRALGLYGQQNPCRACGAVLVMDNYRMADGCPCNSGRGVNHGLVPILTCTCAECNPYQTGGPVPTPEAETGVPVRPSAKNPYELIGRALFILDGVKFASQEDQWKAVDAVAATLGKVAGPSPGVTPPPTESCKGCEGTGYWKKFSGMATCSDCAGTGRVPSAPDGGEGT